MSVLFPFILALAKISSTMLNKSGKNRHPCFVLKMKKEAFCLSLLANSSCRISVETLNQSEELPLYK